MTYVKSQITHFERVCTLNGVHISNPFLRNLTKIGVSCKVQNEKDFFQKVLMYILHNKFYLKSIRNLVYKMRDRGRDMTSMLHVHFMNSVCRKRKIRLKTRMKVKSLNYKDLSQGGRDTTHCLIMREQTNKHGDTCVNSSPSYLSTFTDGNSVSIICWLSENKENDSKGISVEYSFSQSQVDSDCTVYHHWHAAHTIHHRNSHVWLVVLLFRG
jgi:hypothetical protein